VSAARGDSSHTANRSATAVWRTVASSCLRLRGLLRRLAGFVSLAGSDLSDRDSSRSWACSPRNCKYSDKSAAIVSFAFVFSSHLIRTGVGRRSRLIAILRTAHLLVDHPFLDPCPVQSKRRLSVSDGRIVSADPRP
ncbi:conserved hypothetical protein, partial [Trichinella spiralis]|uniref:hypothetical protein n=1 Tax=Trichinella spiralis TaxID=6334 RepID=UPI0001EFE0D9